MPTLLRVAYPALAAWQLVWFLILPAPLGARIPWLAVLAVTPLLLTLRGVISLDVRRIEWASYLLLAYLVVGLVEAWSNPPQRLAAIVQVALVCSCLAAIVMLNRQRGRKG
jgi:uncharacterized membrane protein